MFEDNKEARELYNKLAKSIMASEEKTRKLDEGFIDRCSNLAEVVKDQLNHEMEQVRDVYHSRAHTQAFVEGIEIDINELAIVAEPDTASRSNELACAIVGAVCSHDMSTTWEVVLQRPERLLNAMLAEYNVLFELHDKIRVNEVKTHTESEIMHSASMADGYEIICKSLANALASLLMMKSHYVERVDAMRGQINEELKNASIN